MSSNYTGGSFIGNRLFYVDGDHSIVRPVGTPLVSYPFEGDSHAPGLLTAALVAATNPTGFKYALQGPDLSQNNSQHQSFVLEQRFRVAFDFYSPLPLDTPYDIPAYWSTYQGILALSQLILVNESPLSPVDGGFVEWTRTYAVIPKPRNSYESFTFQFPGISPAIIGLNNNDDLKNIPALSLFYDQGAPINRDIVCRVERKFFLVHGGNAPLAFSPNYDDPASPFYVVQKFAPFFGNLYNEQQYVFDNDMMGLVDFKDLGGLAKPAPMRNTIPPKSESGANTGDSGIPYLNFTDPFQGLIGNAEICVKASQFRPWRGNIMEKTTLYSTAL